MSTSIRSEKRHLVKMADDIEMEMSALKIAKRALLREYERNVYAGIRFDHWSDAVDCIDILLRSHQKELDSVISDLKDLLCEE